MGQLETFRRQMNSERVRHDDIMTTRAQETVVNGRFVINNTGEARKSIVFPVAFSKLPVITFGVEIAPGFISTRAPVITAEVYDWQFTERLPISRLYTGAKVLVVSEGATVSKFTITWSASGIAYSNPRS